MTDAPKQYRYKPLVSVAFYDDRTGYYALRDSDGDLKNVIRETFERDYEPVEQAAQGWISVEDRLPPVGIEVLVIDEYDNYSRDTIDEDSDGFSWIDDGEYTHWRELPEPPAREV